MGKPITVIIIALVIVIGLFIFSQRSSDRQKEISYSYTKLQGDGEITLPYNNMKLSSSAFQHNGSIPSKYTCDGDNVNPPLSIVDAPEETQSFVLIMEDPDVPKHLREDGMWDHWVVFNIPPDTTEIMEGQEPKGVHGTGTSGNSAYYGPCPPDREHRYFFKLYALDVMLDLTEGSSKSDIEMAMEGHVLDKTELVGKYNRN